MQKSKNMKEKLMDNTTTITTVYPTTQLASGGVNTDGFSEELPPPFYSCDSGGVYYHTFSKQGKKFAESKTRLSDQIRLMGYGYDGGVTYRVIQYRDRKTKQTQTDVIHYGDIGANWKELQGKGIAIKAGRTKRDKLADYLMSEGKTDTYTVTEKAGWINDFKGYVLPSGEILGNDEGNIIYNGDKSQATAYATTGTLDDWKQHIGRYAVGNSRLSLTIGASLASPLLRLVDI